MYCKRCKIVLKTNETTCPNCNFDNDLAYDNNNLEKLNTSSNKTSKTKTFIPMIVLFFLLCFGFISLYLIKDTKAQKSNVNISSTTKKTTNYKTFEFQNIKLTYPDNFGSSKNTIFYKNNTAINISIKNIDLTEYNNIINGNDCLDYKLGTIDTKTYAGDNTYSYIFIYQDLYYQIIVNYINDTTTYTEELSKTISKIINSIETN